MTLQQLRYVVCVSETGNITTASEKLFISQPSLTNAIKNLEEEMNINIFNRNNKGVTLTPDGITFLSYARQVLEQADLLTNKFVDNKERKPVFSVSCQHYSFAVNAFIDVINEFKANSYNFTLRETQTYEIITDVSQLISEIGILYLSSKNEEVITKILKENDLTFDLLFTAKPHVFISNSHPLAKKDKITLDELSDYPYLSFEQGQYNSFYFSEEILSTLDRRKNIKVRDRATLFNLVIGLNGYTVSSGVIDKKLNGENIISKPLDMDEYMKIGIIKLKNHNLSPYGISFLEAIKKYIN